MTAADKCEKAIGCINAARSRVLSAMPAQRRHAQERYDHLVTAIDELEEARSLVVEAAQAPLSVPMLLWCPECGKRHVDKGAFATKPHHTHACQTCGHCWRPAIVPTTGVRFLPGFKDAE